jgi:hypothetical protein
MNQNLILKIKNIEVNINMNHINQRNLEKKLINQKIIYIIPIKKILIDLIKRNQIYYINPRI